MLNNLTMNLFRDISQLIDSTKHHIAHYANSSLVILNWQIGQRINQDILKETRAEYGEQVVSQLAKQLKEQYGSGFDRPNLSRMIRFSRLFPDQKICVMLSHKLSWSHFIKLIAVEEKIKRDFYTEMCQLENWNVRILRKK